MSDDMNDDLFPSHRLTSPFFATLSGEERAAIRDAIRVSERWGYGNIMAHLATAWATKLRDQGLSEEAAIAHVSNRTPYPLRKKTV